MCRLRRVEPDDGGRVRRAQRQSYVEDCQVCCKPNVLDVRYDTGEQEFVITAQLE